MILDVKNLSVTLGGRSILEDITFSVNKGEYLCIVGENGSGKSTLIKTILGLVPKKSGTVTFSPEAGVPGYLPQAASSGKDVPASVSEVVLAGCLNQIGRRPFFGAKEKKTARENIERLGIGDLAHRPFNELSGGQKQRVLLARALCACKNVLLLDEPVTGLDPVVTEEMYKLIGELNRERGLTVLMVSHDIRTATAYADKVLHLGTTVRFFGDTAAYLQSELGIHFSGRCCHDV